MKEEVINLYNIWIYILLFLLYSITGWIVEVINAIYWNKKFINRGFLIGPYCPIYGFGSILMILFLYKYIDDYIVIFVMCVVICGILEYVTSFLMEKIFKTRWWDYSNKKFNINGRICLETLVLFGIGGLLIMYIINPIYVNIINIFSFNTIKIISIVGALLFIADVIVSFKIILNFKLVAKNIKKDSTEEITKMVRNVLLQKSRLSKRLVQAFPDFQSMLKKYKDKIK
ncbi:MAG: putative ABC transporter permease [Bacilli bacterium]|nr:putative ABC transporter permease [Bacilli bacterium]